MIPSDLRCISRCAFEEVHTLEQPILVGTRLEPAAVEALGGCLARDGKVICAALAGQKFGGSRIVAG
jgi:hypothetical protein